MQHYSWYQEAETETVQNGRKIMERAFLLLVYMAVAAVHKHSHALSCMESVVVRRVNEWRSHMAGGLELLERWLLSLVAFGWKAEVSDIVYVCSRESGTSVVQQGPLIK